MNETSHQLATSYMTTSRVSAGQEARAANESITSRVQTEGGIV